MSTRGCYGFRKNGEDKITYNHFDSYPDGLGRSMVRFCRDTPIAELNAIYDRIILVNEIGKPSPEQQEECAMYRGASGDDWYSCLYHAQGEPDSFRHGLRYMIDNRGFIKDSLFCEYGYIVNLDENILEFWRGFQKKPDMMNRYGQGQISGFYPCRMVTYYPLDCMLDYSVASYVDDMNKLTRQMAV